MKNTTKMLAIIPMFALMMAFAVAAGSSYSLRATGGTVNYVDSLDIKSISISDFSAHENNAKGQGSVVIQGVTEDGKNFRLSLKLKLSNILVESSNRFYVDNTATGTYAVQGSTPKRVVLNTVRYDYNKVTGLVNVAGEGDVKFRVTGMSGRNLI